MRYGCDPQCLEQLRQERVLDGVAPAVREHERIAVRAAARISSARSLSGTRCARFAFMRVAAMGQRPHVPHDIALRAEHRPDPVARVVGSVFHGDGPLQDRADALADRLHGPRLGVPDWVKDLQHVGAGHLRDGPRADARECEALQTAEPFLGLPGTAPAGLLLLHHGGCGLGEGGHGLGAALVGERVSARAGELAVGEGLLAGLGERDQMDAAESEFVFPAADDEALDPASGSGTLDVKVEAVAIGVPPDGCGTDEGGGEGVMGMSALGLGFPAFRGGDCHTNHPHIIRKKVADFTRRSDS